MQLLTASKLSTVAMLAMAAVLFHSPVNAVPMEQAGVEEVPSPKAPVDLSAYKPSESGDPSPKSYEDLFDLLTTVPDPTEQLPSGSSDSIASSDQLQQKAKILVDKLDEAWDKYRGPIKTSGRPRKDYLVLVTVTAAWEKAFEGMNGQVDLKDCPYDQLPYTPDQRDKKSSLSSQQVHALHGSGFDSLFPYVRHNICRLAINGAYPWLLRLHTMDCYHARNVIYTVLGQLRLFTTDEAEAIKLDKLLKLFASISQAQNEKAEVDPLFKPLLMAAMPETVPAISHSPDDNVEGILLHVAKERQSESPTPLMAGGKPLADIIKPGSLNTLLNDLEPTSKYLKWLSYYLPTLESEHLTFDRSLGKTVSQAYDDVLDEPSIGFKSVGNVILQKGVFLNDQWKFHSFEVLVNVLDLPQFINLYRRIPQDRRDLSLIVMTGRSHKGPDAMYHVIKDILGEQGTPIKGGIQVDAKHLAQLVQGCAMVCTEDNWKLFLDELLDRLKVTEHLPSCVVKNASAPASPAKEIAGEITPLITHLNKRLASSSYTGPAKQTTEEATKKVVDLMNEAIEELYTIHDSKNTVKGAHRV